MKEKILVLLHDRKKMREIALYLLFGALTTLVDFLIYSLMRRVLGIDAMEPDGAAYRWACNAANLTAWVGAVIFAFFTNKKYVFDSKKRSSDGAWKEFWLFVSARVLSYLIFQLGLYTALLYVMRDFPAKIVTNVLVVLFNYVASKWVIFRK